MTKLVQICYTNYRNETRLRTIYPIEMKFEETVYHPGEQWILYARDTEKGAIRAFAMKDIKAWVTL